MTLAFNEMLAVLPKLRPILGPTVLTLLAVFLLGYVARGKAEDQTTRVSALEATTVRRDTFQLFQADLNGRLARIEESQRRVNVYICRRSPDLC